MRLRPDSFAGRLFDKVASSAVLARMLAPMVDQALPQEQAAPQSPAPDAPAQSNGGAAAKAPETNPLADPQGVIHVPKAHQLSPQQLDHILTRIAYDRKHRDLASEISTMVQAQAAARPYERG